MRQFLLRVFAVVLAVLLSVNSLLAAPAEYTEDSDDIYDVDKRSGFRPVPFPCNGYDNVPRCLHNGKGPRKTWTKSGRFCVCLCPSKWVGPECGYAASTFGKRAYDGIAEGLYGVE